MLFLRQEFLAAMGAGALVLLVAQYIWHRLIRALRRAGIQLHFVWHIKIPEYEEGRSPKRLRFGEAPTDSPKRVRRRVR